MIDENKKCTRSEYLRAMKLSGETKEHVKHNDMLENIAYHIENQKALISDLVNALEYGQSIVDAPEQNCSCHNLNPPCGDCVDYGSIREFIALSNKALINSKKAALK